MREQAMRMVLTERSGTQHTADDLSDPSHAGMLVSRVVPRISAQDTGVSMGPHCRPRTTFPRSRRKLWPLAHAPLFAC